MGLVAVEKVIVLELERIVIVTIVLVVHILEVRRKNRIKGKNYKLYESIMSQEKY